MLYRTSLLLEDSQNLTRESLLLFQQQDLCEADTRLRELDRRAQSTDAQEDHLRLAHERIRAGHDHHQVGLALHRSSPEAHAAFAKSLDTPHQRATVDAAPHFHDWDTHDQSYNAHVSDPPKHPYDPNHPAWEKHNKIGSAILTKKMDAWGKLERTARRHDVDIQHLIRPRPDEPMHKHLGRIMYATVMKEANSRNRGSTVRGDSDEHMAVFDYKKPADRLAATANHHWGHSHETKVVVADKPDQRRSQNFHWTEHRVSTTPKKSTL